MASETQDDPVAEEFSGGNTHGDLKDISIRLAERLMHLEQMVLRCSRWTHGGPGCRKKVVSCMPHARLMKARDPE